MIKQKVVMHIDVNSAFLSWHAAYNQQIGIEEDIMNKPCVIGGNEKKRHGIVLAKSIPAKKLGIKTGQSLMEARLQCPDLKIIMPRYDIYVRASRKLRDMLKEYTPKVDVFSIDECFMDLTGTELINGDAINLAYQIKERIKTEFGYTVNIGISENKLLAKQASEFEKPDKVHTLYVKELKNKLWPLPVGELFMVGRRTEVKLNNIGINTIGQLANADRNMLSSLLKSHGRLIYDYARGIDCSTFSTEESVPFKGVGNGSTIPFDVEDSLTAHRILLSLVETASKRLRDEDLSCRVIAVGIKDKSFGYQSHQRRLAYFTNCTYDLYVAVQDLFDEAWDLQPIRHMNVRFTDLEKTKVKQLNFFQNQYSVKMEKLDCAIDYIREKYGKYSIIRGGYIDSGLSPILGGYPDDDYPDMRSIL
ncbi:MAG: DNA polymerase IV [Clostridiales bacterium 38_11]|nr:MAG: DNA polymerase IV [Clostridiales bacterium 38_11]HBH12896.1 DNA polymerase IV [Clostridiales bacterium]